jgi:hypothetical protein
VSLLDLNEVFVLLTVMLELFVLLASAVPFALGLYVLQLLDRRRDDDGDDPPPPDTEPPDPQRPSPSSPRSHPRRDRRGPRSDRSPRRPSRRTTPQRIPQSV